MLDECEVPLAVIRELLVADDERVAALLTRERERRAPQLGRIERALAGLERTGVLVAVETNVADTVAVRASAQGPAVVQPLRDEAWGQRHVILRDPEGLLVDVVQPIAPSADFAAACSGTHR